MTLTHTHTLSLSFPLPLPLLRTSSAIVYFGGSSNIPLHSDAALSEGESQGLAEGQCAQQSSHQCHQLFSTGLLLLLLFLLHHSFSTPVADAGCSGLCSQEGSHAQGPQGSAYMQCCGHALTVCIPPLLSHRTFSSPWMVESRWGTLVWSPLTSLQRCTRTRSFVSLSWCHCHSGFCILFLFPYLSFLLFSSEDAW